MLPTAVTAEAPTACGGGGTPASAAVRPRRETTGSGYGSALPKLTRGSVKSEAKLHGVMRMRVEGLSMSPQYNGRLGTI